MSEYPPKQKTGKQVVKDMIKFARTAKRTKKMNIDPKNVRGGIRL